MDAVVDTSTLGAIVCRLVCWVDEANRLVRGVQEKKRIAGGNNAKDYLDLKTAIF